MELRGAALELRIDAHEVLPVQPDVEKRTLHELAHRMIVAGGDHVVVGCVPLQHEPHRSHVILRVAPVAPRIEVAEDELVLQSERDGRGAMRNLARQKLERPARRLVVVEDPRAGEQAVALSIRARAEMRVRLRDTVGRERGEGCLFRLRHLVRLAEDLRRGRLVEADLHVHGANRLEQGGRTDGGELRGFNGLIP